MLNPLREPSRFDRFWALANAELRDAGKPELGLASARQLFAEMRERARALAPEEERK